MTHKSYIDAAHGGNGWVPREASSLEEQSGIFGNYGQHNEFGKILSVVVHRPYISEFYMNQDPSDYHFDQEMSMDKAQDQHDEFVEKLKRCGINVEYLNPEISRPNHLYVRDLFTMTKMGAVISRMAAAVRAGEELDALRFMGEKRIPIAAQVLGEAHFEGPDLVLLNSDLALCAIGIRSNIFGIKQVSTVLKEFGIDIVPVQTTYGCGHLDGVLSIVSNKKALIIPRMISHVAVQTMKMCGYDLIELRDEDEIGKMAINLLAVDNGVVMIPSDCSNTKILLEKKGIECVPVDVSELRKGGGGLHCMTGVLQRES
ncbi:dimethylarginine dimethylaminohydrolase family protein [Burkholderia gladioli]|uniref:dimethylarginine dimethylaminohydrolase family protein n=1 Tax=Burkholderia gladioli TaxID=28095 RepID=UPI001640F955|nr:arginine deiminase family protein [Burkholderia gladioli]